MTQTDDMRLVGEPKSWPLYPSHGRPSSFTPDYDLFDRGRPLYEKELVFLNDEELRRRKKVIERESGRVRVVKPALRRSPNWDQ